MWFLNDDEKERGIDYDLSACLQYNPQDGFDKSDIDMVLAVWEGENDIEAWHWVLRLNDGKFVYLSGSCDYTGWDCQSGADSIILSRDLPLKEAMTQMNSLHDEGGDVYESLMEQLRTYKKKTWTETMDEEMRGEIND